MDFQRMAGHLGNLRDKAEPGIQPKIHLEAETIEEIGIVIPKAQTAAVVLLKAESLFRFKLDPAGKTAVCRTDRAKIGEVIRRGSAGAECSVRWPIQKVQSGWDAGSAIQPPSIALDPFCVVTSSCAASGETAANAPITIAIVAATLKVQRFAEF